MALFGKRKPKADAPDPAPSGAKSSAYERRKRAARDRNVAIAAEGRDIGAIPPVANPERRERAARSFRFFCEKYFPERFPLEWSDDHLEVQGKIEQATLHGALFAVAMPRGSGKTTLAEVAILWGALYGLHMMVAGLAATKDKSVEILDSIKSELENNERLAADFPEVCKPIRALEGITNRCRGQLCQGERTRIAWTKHKIILPTIAGSAAAGVIIKVGGLTGGDVRGMKHTRQDGTVVRPTFALIDDPQTDKTANSPVGCRTREKLLQGAVLGMAGPGKKIAAVMPCTVIAPGDMADNILDREKHPDWQGIRTKFIYEWPTNEKLWHEYAEIRAESMRAGRGLRDATEFYRKHRAAMDAGARVAWPARYEDDELSAIQSAWNLRLRDEDVFWAEYQNEPATADADADFLNADQIAVKVNGLERGQVPVACNYLTMYQDVHDKMLFWMVCAWEDNFTGYVIDYGTHPDQRARHFSMRKAKRTLGRASQGAGRDGAIFAGLAALNDEFLSRQWKRDDGVMMPLNLAMIDANWETTLVHKFIRERGAVHLFPAKGVGITASSQPWEDRKPKEGERNGDHWRIAPTPRGTARGRHIVIDTNHWKTFVHRRLATAPGDAGCMTLFGRKRDDGQPVVAELHRLLAEHLTAENRIPTTGRGRTVDEWKSPPSRPDNHWFDCLVGCAVLASWLGASVIPGTAKKTSAKTGAKKKRKRRVQTLH